ncbi:hypothetical protein E4U43_005688 [Claviceps pusilla]|uniref:Haloacid dehalogenase-like hydrolase n=1 Tax=Claviceps pusilla TaxID=123648 RepID=A0A9P7N4J8_9HYPO|nr:hypothetical protein E4U43_005688 [Claviceps pusilla]
MHLVVDFDGTITQSDTIAELVRSAMQHQHRQRPQTQTDHNLPSAWEHALQTYLAEYRAYHADYHPPETRRTTPALEASFLAGLKPLEEASLARVSHSGLFVALSRHALHDMGAEAVSSGRVRLRSGWPDLLAEATRRGIPLTVLSVHWSRSFIQGVLSHDLLPSGPPIDVLANEIDDQGGIVGPAGDEPSRLVTAGDKLAVLQRWTAAAEHEVIYLGDSPTDLTCLLAAQTGIVLAAGEDGSSPVLKTLRRIGIQVKHVGGIMAARAGSADGTEQVVFWARDMREVLQSGVLGT